MKIEHNSTLDRISSYAIAFETNVKYTHITPSKCPSFTIFFMSVDMPELKLYPAQLDHQGHVLYCVVELNNNNMFGLKK